MSSRQAWMRRACLLTALLLAAACGGPEARKAKYYGKGQALFEKGEYVKAALELKNALQIDPKFAKAHALLGMTFLKQGEPKKAFGSLSKAAELDPGLLDAQITLGKLFLIGGDPVKAREKADLVLAAKPGEEGALLVKAGALAAGGESDDAVAILEEVLSRNPKTPDGSLLLAQIRLRDGRVHDARKALEQLIAHDPGNPQGRALLARVLESQGNASEAETHWKALAAKDPKDGRTQVALARFYTRSKRPADAEKVLADLVAAQPAKSEYRIQLARFHAAQRNQERMVATLERSIKDLPTEYPAYDVLARYQLQKGSKADVERILNQALGSVTNLGSLASARVLLAKLRQSEGKGNEAFALVEKALEDAPRHSEARLFKAELLAGRGDYPGAIADYRVLLKDDPDDERAIAALARTHLLNNEPALAEDLLKRTLDRNPKLRAPRLVLAAFYSQQKKGDQARAELTKALEYYPDDREILAALGDLALVGRDLKAAAASYDRLQELDPDNPQVLYRSGVASRARGKAKEAAEFFEKALEANPDFEPALVQLVRMHLEKKDLDGAIELCEKEATARPEHAGYRLLLGSLYSQKKDYPAARNAFEEALGRNLDGVMALSGILSIEASLGTVDAAVSRYRERIQKDPNDAVSALLLGASLEVKGDIDAAQAAYEGVLKTRPDSVIAANNLAFWLTERDYNPQALERAGKLLEPLVAKYGRNPMIADTAAWLHYRNGQYEKGRDLLLALPGGAGALPPVANYHLGVLHQKLGDKAKAKASLELALKDKADFPGRGEAEKLLAGL